jgi:prepilin-type N-terminal cleavage/methylation domain-containing protein
MAKVSTLNRTTRRGFTLVELMTVVVIVIVLAGLAVYAVRKYVWTAKTTEAYDMINSIKSAQEAYRAETFAYSDVSGGDLGKYYPEYAAPKQGKASWDDASCSAMCARWRALGVSPHGPVQFRYSTVAGSGQVAVNGLGSTNYQLPATAPGPWYVVQAVGDQNGDGVLSVFLSSSFSSDVYSERESE